MIDFYAMGSPNAVKIFIALEELGLPYRLHVVDIARGEHFAPHFAKLNPNMKIPVIIDHDGPDTAPMAIFESGAILIYLAEKSSGLLPRDPVGRYKALEWLMVQLTGLGPMAGQLNHFVRFAPPGNDYARTRYATQVRRVCRTLEARLSECVYLAGGEYSIADVATFSWTYHLYRTLPDAMETLPALAAWSALIEQRPAVTRALAAVDRVRTQTTPFEKADPEMLDRIFGRGAFAAT